MAILCGLIPAIGCLDPHFFAILSLLVFGLSIALHIAILIMWRAYKGSAPFAYALIQPVLHFVLLVLALTVGSTNLCAPKELKRSSDAELKKYDFTFKPDT